MAPLPSSPVSHAAAKAVEAGWRGGVDRQHPDHCLNLPDHAPPATRLKIQQRMQNMGSLLNSPTARMIIGELGDEPGPYPGHENTSMR